MKLKVSILFVVIIALTQTACAQSSKPYFGWNLDYESVLEENNVGRDTWIWEWLTDQEKYNLKYKFETPAKKWISEYDGEPIISSILADYPALHAGEHQTMWLFRTGKKAYYRLKFDVRETDAQMQEISLETYDDLYKQMSEWEEYKPVKCETESDYLPGYIGFLSFYDRGKSRQMLLTMEDFVKCEVKESDPAKIGRLLKALVSAMPGDDK